MTGAALQLELVPPASPPTSSALLSPCGRYRFRLERRWSTGPTACFILLHAGTGDAEVDDPAVRRCLKFARRAGAGRLVVVSLYAWRAVDAAELADVADPVGADNDAHIVREALSADLVVCGWGDDQPARRRASVVVPVLRRAGVRLHALRLTADGSPANPLHLPARLRPFPWDP